MASPFPSIDDPAALAISARLSARIAVEIDDAGGWIPFSRFMELALYEPGLGYYSAGALKIGRHPADGSDFVTAPELTPLFGRALARPLAQVLEAGGDTVVELGGGSGRLAVDLLLELERLAVLPIRYRILEVSGDLRARQAATLGRDAPHLVDRVEWIDALPEAIDGVVIGNEVLDALPVELVVWDGAAWCERGIARDDDRLRYVDRPIRDWLAGTVAASIGDAAGLPVPYVTEVHPAACALVAAIARRLSPRSVALFIDYGFPASEYYHPQRVGGTLRAHRRHRSTDDLLSAPGLQDLTAHVDFTAVATAAVAEGARLVGYTSQAAFLIDCGIGQLIEGVPSEVARWAPQAAALQLLLSEAEMGELFKAVAIARRQWALTGFGRSDRIGALGPGQR